MYETLLAGHMKQESYNYLEGSGWDAHVVGLIPSFLASVTIVPKVVYLLMTGGRFLLMGCGWLQQSSHTTLVPDWLVNMLWSCRYRQSKPYRFK